MGTILSLARRHLPVRWFFIHSALISYGKRCHHFSPDKEILGCRKSVSGGLFNVIKDASKFCKPP